MPLRIKYITFIAGMFISHAGFSGDSVNVAIKCRGCEEAFIKDLPPGYLNAGEAGKIARRLLNQLRLSGYFEAHTDTSMVDEQSLDVLIEPGPRYEWERLRLSNFPHLSSANPGRPNIISGGFDYKTVASLADAAIRHGETNGYPFASLYFDSAKIEENRITATMVYSEGPYIVFDSLRVTGAEVRSAYLATYLDIMPGSPFDQGLIDQIEKKLSALPYLRLVRRELSFQNLEATISLEVEPVQANRFEGVAGMAPDNDSGGVLLTGQLDLLLHNLFKSGKSFALQWCRLRPASQRLDVRYSHPRLLSSKLDAAFFMNLLKEDSSFLNRRLGFSLGYNLNARSTLSFLSEQRFSSAISPEKTGEFPDMKWFSGGASFGFNSLDDLFFPAKGHRFTIKGLIGNKSFNDPVHESLNGLQYTLESESEWYIQAVRKWSLVHKTRGGYVAGKGVFPGDLFRIGGMNDLRGFGENEFPAELFLASILEIRYLLDRNSFLTTFYDQGLTVLSGDKNYPAGIGAGISLKVKSGLLNLAYAIGTQKGQPFNLNSSKIHFGFETIF